ncbi:MAG: GtrA family protein [Proteobacteria bacterium]|nr:GtrA family protein [Pseudomonadota bacterium]
MLKKQLIRFGLIGLTALSVHLLSVMLFVKTCEIPPLGANVLGFLLAFQVSYWGHYKWTFTADHLPHKQASLRFFIIALSSFGINELMYAGLLQTTHLPYDLALLMVLIFISVSTFILSKFWAFR